MKTAILKVLTTLPELATECLLLLGEGARPEATQEEMFFSLCNTPVQNGFIRIPVADHIATALQWMQDNNVTSEHAEIIRVEWDGQDMVPGLITMVDEEGIKTTTESLIEIPLMVGQTEEQVLEDGTVIPSQPIYLGRMAA